jgi:hypothetical protein
MRSTRFLVVIIRVRSSWFGSEAGCRDYIRRLRWPDGFICRRCGATGSRG